MPGPGAHGNLKKKNQKYGNFIGIVNIFANEPGMESWSSLSLCETWRTRSRTTSTCQTWIMQYLKLNDIYILRAEYAPAPNAYIKHASTYPSRKKIHEESLLRGYIAMPMIKGLCAINHKQKGYGRSISIRQIWKTFQNTLNCLCQNMCGWCASRIFCKAEERVSPSGFCFFWLGLLGANSLQTGVQSKNCRINNPKLSAMPI